MERNDTKILNLVFDVRIKKSQPQNLSSLHAFHRSALCPFFRLNSQIMTHTEAKRANFRFRISINRKCIRHDTIRQDSELLRTKGEMPAMSLRFSTHLYIIHNILEKFDHLRREPVDFRGSEPGSDIRDAKNSSENSKSRKNPNSIRLLAHDSNVGRFFMLED